jgi:SAM-dependent methyltransferase
VGTGKKKMNENNPDQFHFATRLSCPICDGSSIKIGEKRGRYIRCDFSLRECVECTYVFIENPCIDFSRIYNEDYYRAKGADPLTDYMFELEHPNDTIRAHELRGIVEAVRSIKGSPKDKAWLDFGCGNGALVRHLQDVSLDVKFVAGFEEGWIAEEARRNNINILASADLDGLNGSFDIVTAIEVLEHVLHPNEVLSRIRKLLKPGGLFFCTTGNSAPFRRNLLEWGYVVPEVHVGFFNPKSMSAALERADFSVQAGRFLPGFEKIIRFKILKTLGFKRDSLVFNLVPWSIVSRVVDSKYRISELPMALAQRGA